MTSRSQGAELERLRHAGHPSFYAGWGRDVVGLVLDDDTGWDEVAELMNESCCVRAPRKLVALLARHRSTDPARPPAPGRLRDSGHTAGEGGHR